MATSISERTEALTPEELGIDMVRYIELCIESLDCQQAECHVMAGDRRVYAA